MPQMGTMGTVVTVTGANFQTSAQDNKAAIGTFSTQVIDDATTPTATTLKLNVPSAGASGKISIATPFGAATSAGDFYALPAAIQAADVAFTGRLVVDGPTVTVTTAAAGKKAVLLFDAQAGQSLHLLTSASTFAGSVTATIYRQDGTNFETLVLNNNGAADFRQVLGLDGTYTLVLSPASSDKGSLQLSLIADATGSMGVDGSAAVSLSAGRNARFRFRADADRGYGLAVTGLSFTPAGGSLTASVRRTDGALLTSCTLTASSSCDFNPAVFTIGGDYLLDFDPAGLYAATFNASLTGDTGGVLTMDAEQPTLVTIAREGQNARYTLDGIAGQLVSLVFTGNTLDDGNPGTSNRTWLSLNKPSNLFSGFVVYNYDHLSTSAPGVALDAALPETGTYNVWVAPEGLDKGTIKLQVKSFVTGELTLDSSTAVNLSAGRKARFSFTAEAGKDYGLALTGLTFAPTGGSLTASLRRADGTLLVSCSSFTVSSSCDFNGNYFTSSGIYYVDLYPSGAYAASFNVLLNKDNEGTLAVDAESPTPVTIAREGQNARYTFSGIAGQRVSVVFTGSTLDDGNASTRNLTWLSLNKPSKPFTEQLAYSYAYIDPNSPGVVLDATLPETGTYTVWIAPEGLDKGAINVQVKTVLAGELALGEPVAANLSAGRRALYTFPAEAGKGYSLALTGLTFMPAGGSLTALFRKPDGTQVLSCAFRGSDSCDLGAEYVTSSGVYTLGLGSASAYAASFQAVLSRDQEGTLGIDGPPVTVTIPVGGGNARYTFTGTAGQQVTLLFSGNTLDDGNAATTNYTWLALTRPSSPTANPVTYGQLATGTASMSLSATLPETGTYTIVLAPLGLDKGTVNVRVTTISTSELSLDSRTPVSLGTGSKARYTFPLEAGKGYSLALTSMVFTPAGGSLTASLKRADGAQLLSCTFTGSNSCDLGAEYIASSGTYTLELGPAGAYATTFDAMLSRDREGTLSIDGPPVAVTIPSEGANAKYTFNGTAGQSVTLVFSDNALDDGNAATTNYTWIALTRPSSPLANPVTYTQLPTGTAGVSLNATLPETGTYTIVLAPVGLDKGTINVQVKSR